MANFRIMMTRTTTIVESMTVTVEASTEEWARRDATTKRIDGDWVEQSREVHKDIEAVINLDAKPKRD